MIRPIEGGGLAKKMITFPSGRLTNKSPVIRVCLGVESFTAGSLVTADRCWPLIQTPGSDANFLHSRSEIRLSGFHFDWHWCERWIYSFISFSYTARERAPCNVRLYDHSLMSLQIRRWIGNNSLKMWFPTGTIIIIMKAVLIFIGVRCVCWVGGREREKKVVRHESSALRFLTLKRFQGVNYRSVD